METVKCIKTLLMLGTQEEAFTNGKRYSLVAPPTFQFSSMYCLIDNQGEKHVFGLRKFNEHFNDYISSQPSTKKPDNDKE